MSLGFNNFNNNILPRVGIDGIVNFVFLPGIAENFTSFSDNLGSTRQVSAPYNSQYNMFGSGEYYLPSATANGYDFVNWRYDDYNSFLPGYIAYGTFASTTTPWTEYLTANWTPKTYTITLVYNDDITANKIFTVTFNNTYGNNLSTPTRTGYKFNGWFTLPVGGNLVTSTTKVTIANNHTLYAQWTPEEYSVTFFSNGGFFESGNDSFIKKYPFNTKINLLNFNTEDPLTKERKGYNFLGWNTNIDAKEGLSDYIVTASNLQKLYAIWELSSNAYIYSNNSWKLAIPYIYDGINWKISQSKIYNGENWTNKT